MNEIYSDHKGKIRQGNIDLFLEIALENYFSASKYISETEELLKDKTKIFNPITDKIESFNGFNHLDRLFYIQNEYMKHEIQGIISLAIFYEALINEIGVTELGSRYFKANLDNLSIIAKWEVVLKLIYGKSIDTEKHHFENMNNVIKLRNKLAHYKTKLMNEGDNNLHKDFFLILKNGLSSIEQLFNELNELDQKKGIIKFKTFKKHLDLINKIKK